MSPPQRLKLTSGNEAAVKVLQPCFMMSLRKSFC